MMIDPNAFEARAAALEKQLRERLGLRGRDLATLLRRAGRHLPKRQRQAAAILTDAQARMTHPRLARLLNGTGIDRAFTDLRAHLVRIDPRERRKTAILTWAYGLVINLLVLALVILLVLRWLSSG